MQVGWTDNKMEDAKSGGLCSLHADISFHSCVLGWWQQYTVPQFHS